MPTAKAKSKERKPRIPPLTIENAHIVYRNFSGAAKKFNAKGLRNFHVVLDPDQAKKLEQDGWNVKWPKPREDGEDRNPTIKVKVRFDNYPPQIHQITSRGDLLLDEETVCNLDFAEIENVHLTIVGSYNELDTGWKGFTAYLSKMVVFLSETDIVAKYASIRKPREEDDN